MDPRTSLHQIKQTWRPPKELECSRPREVGLTWAGKIVAGLAVAMLLGGFFGGLALYIQASRDQEAQNQFVESGIDTEALVMRHWTSGKDPVRYWVEYSYRVEGRTYAGRLSTNRNSWFSLQKTGTLEIRYLPADPQRSLALGYESELLPIWVSILVTVVLGAVVLLCAHILSWQRRLLAEGRPAPAIVTRIGRSADHGKKIAHYVFMDFGGRLIDGKSDPQRKPPAEGSVLNVIYEPDRENHNGVYPLPLVKVDKH